MVLGISVRHNSPTLLKRLRAYQSFIEKQLNGILIQEALLEWRLRASDIIENVIYGAYTPTVYKRGRDSGQPGLDQSLTVESTEGNEAVLFLDSRTIPDKTRGGFDKGYAAYFLVPGSGFLAKTLPDNQFRDFMGDSESDINKWVGMTTQIFMEKYRKMFQRAVKISNSIPEVFIIAGRGA